MPTYTKELFNGPANSGEASFLSIFSDGLSLNPKASSPGMILHTCPSGFIDICHLGGGTAALTAYVSGGAIPAWQTFATSQDLPLYRLQMGADSIKVMITSEQSLWIQYNANQSINAQRFQGWVDRIAGQ